MLGCLLLQVAEDNQAELQRLLGGAEQLRALLVGAADNDLIPAVSDRCATLQEEVQEVQETCCHMQANARQDTSLAASTNLHVDQTCQELTLVRLLVAQLELETDGSSCSHASSSMQTDIEVRCAREQQQAKQCTERAQQQETAANSAVHEVCFLDSSLSLDPASVPACLRVKH